MSLGVCTITQYVHNDCEIIVSTRAGDAECFQLRVGLHQWYVFSTLLFILIMYVLHADIGKEPPWVMLFADGLVIEQKLSCSLRDGERHFSPTD